MIDDLSRTLGAVLNKENLPADLAKAQIAFDHPVGGFDPQQTTIDLFLYDIRENLELRSNELQLVRTNGKVSTGRPPLRVACAYLITAWPVGGAEVVLQEHRLLGQVLQVLARYPTIPREFLQGSLVGQEPPLPMVTAVLDSHKNLSEFWTALGNKLRPSLTVTVTIAMDLFEPQMDPMIVTEQLRMGERTSSAHAQVLHGTGEESFRISGTVKDEAQVGVSQATVTLVELGRTARTDSGGHYSLNLGEPGDYTVRVKKGTIEKQITMTVPSPSASGYDIVLP